MRNPAETSASVRCPCRRRPAPGTIDCTRARIFFFLLPLLFYSYTFVRVLISDNVYLYMTLRHKSTACPRPRTRNPIRRFYSPLTTYWSLRRIGVTDAGGQRRRPPHLFVGHKNSYKIMYTSRWTYKSMMASVKRWNLFVHEKNFSEFCTTTRHIIHF